MKHLNPLPHPVTDHRRATWRLLLLFLLPLSALAQPACGEFVPYYIRDSMWDDYRMYCAIKIWGLLDDGTRAVISVDGETWGTSGRQWDFRTNWVRPMNHACASEATEFGAWAEDLLNGRWPGAGDQQWWVLERLESACGRNRSCEGAGAPTVFELEPEPDYLYLGIWLESGSEVELEYVQEREGWELLDVQGSTASCREEGQLRTFTGYMARLLNTPGCDVASPYSGIDDLSMQPVIDRLGEICQG